MAVGEYVRIVVKYWWAIVVAIVICATAGFVYGTFIQSVKYVSTAKLFVAAEGGTSVGESYQNNLFAEGRVNSYAQVATSDQVAARASRALSGQVSPGELQSSTTATAIDKTVILAISVSADSAARAQSEAAAVARETVNVVQELETSRRGGEPAATAIIYDEASLPDSPSGLPAWLLAVAGGAVGLVVGILAALLLGWRGRRKIAGAQALSEAAQFPVLVTIPDEPARAESPVIADLAHDSQGDAYRELRNKVRFTGARRMADRVAPRVVTVVGVAAGDGASTVAVNLATELGVSGSSVLLIDGDLHDHTASGWLAGSAHGAGLSTVLLGESELISTLTPVETISFLPTGPIPQTPGELLGSRSLDVLMSSARQHFDHVVVDAGAVGNGPDASVFAGLSDAVVVVARRGRTTRSRLRAAVDELESVGVVIGTVLTFGAADKSTRNSGTVAADKDAVADSDAAATSTVSDGSDNAAPPIGELR